MGVVTVTGVVSYTTTLCAESGTCNCEEGEEDLDDDDDSELTSETSI